MVGLFPITVKNISVYHYFEECYDEKLKEYQSRIYPNNNQMFIKLIKNYLLSWCYITYEYSIIGAIWLEKTFINEDTATLGVFITEDKYRGSGIGQKAISLFIRNNQEKMGLIKVELNVRENNSRAISCYSKCGFKKMRKYISKRGIPAIHMVMNL